MAMKSVPLYETFLATLGPAPEEVILEDMKHYARALERQLDLLHEFYAAKGLET